MLRTILLSLLCAALTVPAFAHGGSYRGPNGGIPPDQREPTDPEPPPPPPSDPGTPGGPVTPRPNDTPPMPGPDTGGDPRPPPVPPTGFPSSKNKRPRSPSLSFESWRYWWAYNNADILNLKSHVLRVGIISSDPRYYTQGGDKTNRVDVSRPTRTAILRRVIPALVRVLERPGEHDDIVGGVAIALGKAGHESFIPRFKEMIDGRFVTDKGVKVKFGPQTTESAVLALGLLPQLDQHQIDAVRPILLEAIGNEKLRRRDRAWAAVSLGFLRDDKAIPAMTRLLDRRYADDNIPCGILAGIGLMGKKAASARPMLEAALLAGKLNGRDVRNKDRIRAFAGYALAKIGDVEALPTLHKILRSRGSGRVVKRSAAIAAGVLGAKADDGQKKQTVNALLYYLRTAKGDSSGTNFALIALSRVGTRRAIIQLLDVAENGRYSRRPFAALGLATRIFYTDRAAKLGTGEAMDRDLRDRIVNRFRKLSKKFKDSDTRAAFMLARGLVKDETAIDELVKIASKRSANPTLRGYCCEALGLLGKSREDVRDALKLALSERRNKDLRRSAATGLGLLHDPDVVKILVKELKRAKSFAVQGQLIQAIGTIGDNRAIEPLSDLLEDRSQPAQTRAMAAVGLGMIADLLEVPTLSRLSKNYNYRASVRDIDELLFIL